MTVLTDLIFAFIALALLAERVWAQRAWAKERRQFTAALLARSPFEFRQIEKAPDEPREPREAVGAPEGL